jgi:hypothetical protein
MAPEAAREPCVRAALLAHEGEHNRIAGEAVPAFIQQHRAELGLELAELKRTGAPDQAAAVQAFGAGLKVSVARMAAKFKGELVERARQSIDSASRLAQLAVPVTVGFGNWKRVRFNIGKSCSRNTTERY